MFPYTCWVEGSLYKNHINIVIETNPCLKDNGGCEQICDYQNGNLTCGCHLGYQVSANNPKKCEGKFLNLKGQDFYLLHYDV